MRRVCGGRGGGKEAGEGGGLRARESFSYFIMDLFMQLALQTGSKASITWKVGCLTA